MWSVGISVSPSVEAERLGYDERQINRIVIRMAQYFLDRDMRIIFGHDWREDGVMRAVADFAGVVAGRAEAFADSDESMYGSQGPTDGPASAHGECGAGHARGSERRGTGGGKGQRGRVERGAGWRHGR